MPPRVLILRAPGTNCDEETAFAFEQAGGVADRVHINRLLENPKLTDDYQILCLPGGFSYGDDLAAGRILASQIRRRLADRIGALLADDKLVLGICNGFQVLIQTGILLPERSSESGEAIPSATLTDNDSGHFEDRWVELGIEGTQCVLLAGIERIYLPIAHAEGKFVACDTATFDELEQAGQLVLRYRSAGGGEDSDVPYPANPNGSMGNVAGLCDRTGRVLGLMPHPERYIDPTQHPRWTREPERQEGEGMRIFQNAIRYFA